MKTYVNTTNGGTLNLRENPSSNSRILTRIPNHTALDIDLATSEWSRTTYQGYTGYVMNKFLGDTNNITKEDIQRIYNSLKETLKIIEEVLK